jgi:RimJ/RimL family protein N-acetyltransferase
MATMGGVRSEEQAKAIMQIDLTHWERHGFGRWVAHDLVTGQFAGRGGLRHCTIGGCDEVELGYAFLPQFWGQGLATELAEASVRVGFEVLGLAELVCFTLPTNAASRRVMEKVGFRYERDVVYANLPHILCRLTSRVAALRSGP